MIDQNSFSLFRLVSKVVAHREAQPRRFTRQPSSPPDGQCGSRFGSPASDRRQQFVDQLGCRELGGPIGRPLDRIWPAVDEPIRHTGPIESCGTAKAAGHDCAFPSFGPRSANWCQYVISEEFEHRSRGRLHCDGRECAKRSAE